MSRRVQLYVEYLKLWFFRYHNSLRVKKGGRSSRRLCSKRCGHILSKESVEEKQRNQDREDKDGTVG